MTNFLAATLFGSMISFMILISPIVFTVLSANDAKNFLRKFFPRLFIFGMILSSLLLAFTLRELDLLNQKLFYLNYLINFSGSIFTFHGNLTHFKIQMSQYNA